MPRVPTTCADPNTFPGTSFERVARGGHTERTRSPRSPRSAAGSLRVPRVLVALDAVLFEPARYFAIDAGNGRVAGVAVPSLETGLSLVGEGAVASIVGRLRPEVSVVDIDLEGERGHGVAETVAAWARQQGLWSLVRPSGGADGRTHVFVATGGDTDTLSGLVADLRVQFRTSARSIDIRRDVRPLSAPHRTSSHTPLPYGSLTKALAELHAAPWATRTPVSTPGGRSRVPESALSPRPRRQTGLPPAWDAYLRTGALPPVGGTDHSRSTFEAIATGHLLRAGHTADSAWDAITAAHPDAMTKARSNRRRWVRWVWNRAVQDDNAHRRLPHTDPDVAAAVTIARGRLQDLQWRFPVRRRPALLLVGYHVLDRMARTSSRRVPVPERDLVLDTGITDRKTIRAALRALDGAMGLLDTQAWDPLDRSTSSFEFEIPEAPADRGVWVIPPPSSHTPLPRGLWATLPRTCHSLWRVLQTTSDPLTCEELAQLAGITSSLGVQPTPDQVRSTRTALTALARAGLAHCTAAAQWVVQAALEANQAGRARAAHTAMAANIGGERASWRARRVSAWSVARAAALKANHARERAWWGGLERADRGRRHAAWAARYQRLSVLDQEQLKAGLATRRVAAGIDEPARHDHWLDSLSMDAYLQRSLQRQAWFEGLAPGLQQANAASWARHRARFTIARGSHLAQSRREHAELLPSGAAARDQGFIDAQATFPALEQVG
jgi:hypothetical protein